MLSKNITTKVIIKRVISKKYSSLEEAGMVIIFERFKVEILEISSFLLNWSEGSDITCLAF